MIEPFYLKELKPYSLSEVQNILDLKLERTQDLLEQLLSKKIVYYKQEKIIFNYVGLLEYDNGIIFVYPKYINNMDSKTGVQIIKLLRVYSSKENLEYDEFATLGVKTLDNDFNLIPLIDFFHRDYFENGLYYNEVEVHQYNGLNEIDWEKTVNESHAAYKINKSIIHLDYYTKEFSENKANIITRLHKEILTICSNYLYETGLNNYMEYPRVIFEENEFNNQIDENAVSLLNQELNLQFNDRNILLIENMIGFLNKRNYVNNSSPLRLFGTNYFYIVWEKVCGFVFSNQYSLVQHEIDNPIWEKLSGERLVSNRTLTPDIISEVTSFDKQQYMLILDAKYYNITFEKNRFENKNPKLEDITKQYLYDMSLKDYYHKQGYDLKINAFIVPSDGSESELKGKVYLDFMRVDNLNDIFIYSISASTIYDNYIFNKKFNNTDMASIFLNKEPVN